MVVDDPQTHVVSSYREEGKTLSSPRCVFVYVCYVVCMRELIIVRVGGVLGAGVDCW